MFQVITCAPDNVPRFQDLRRGEIPSRWYTDHGKKTNMNNPYRDWVTKRYPAPYLQAPNNILAPSCEVDEWPPFA
jgi:hypothetical protein